MKDESSSADTPFWRFSLDFYRRPGVSDVCLALQDDCGADVNLLLFLFWLASDDRQLSADEVQMLEDNVRDWRRLAIAPLRDTRRRLKGAETLIAPDKQEAFRAKVMAIELEAERLQQEALYEFTQSGPLGTPASPLAAARANVAVYQSVLGTGFPKPAADRLIDAFEAMIA